MTESKKFILMSMSDPKTKKVAEALQNPTCKKILDHLADVPEASEGDLAKDLNLAPNKVHYNLKNLIQAGLDKKTKNFFWSKKGKKIIMYKAANKSIIISPKNSNVPKNIKSILTLAILGVALIVAMMTLINIQNPELNEDLTIKQFASLAELNKFIEENQISNRGGFFEEALGGAFKSTMETASLDSAGSSDSPGFSETNIQVAGVDEADTIKTDGKYIYTLTGTTLTITEAYPADEMKILSEIDLESPINFYINDNTLVIFTNERVTYEEMACLSLDCPTPNVKNRAMATANIYDISDKENPELEHEISVSGNHANSRMIGDYVYLIANQYARKDYPMPLIEYDGELKEKRAEDIYFAPGEDHSFQYTNILAINIKNGDHSDKTVLTGTSHNIYVSKNNIYLTASQYPRYNWGSVEKVEQEKEKTSISKISIDEDKIEFVATGEVKGTILNQFSMDEYEGNFRIATTIGKVWDEKSLSTNNLYILDKNLKPRSNIEGLAPGEKIYSVRFMGKKAYIVTFKKVDPLFVLDLSNADKPKVLGKLKIPGYSDYLHPLDENHIIGIGKDTIEADESLTASRGIDFAWYQGVKMAVFDVTDPENPIELHKIIIGDRGTDSRALHDHKAFLFDKERELLVLPINLAEISEAQKDREYDSRSPAYGEHTFQGAYVYKLNVEDGFELKGRITHYQEDEVEEKSGYYWRGNSDVTRSLYIGDTLYTFSNTMLKANNLEDLDEIANVDLKFKYSYHGEPEYFI